MKKGTIMIGVGLLIAVGGLMRSQILDTNFDAIDGVIAFVSMVIMTLGLLVYIFESIMKDEKKKA